VDGLGWTDVKINEWINERIHVDGELFGCGPQKPIGQGSRIKICIAGLEVERKYQSISY